MATCLQLKKQMDEPSGAAHDHCVNLHAQK